MTHKNVTADTELMLTHEGQRALVSPWGASLRRYFQRRADGTERDIVWGYSGGRNKQGGQGDVLMPFPGRIARGRYSFDGRSFQLECNDKEGPNAIHGFVRALPWTIDAQSAHDVTFGIALHEREYAPRGYPFSLRARVTYSLGDDGLSCRFTVENKGGRAAPVGVGFHPYFTVGRTPIDGAEARIPARGYLEFNAELTPTGRILPVEGSEWDYRRSRAVGPKRFNHCFVDLDREADGWCTALLRNPESGNTVEVTMDASFRAIVVYSGDAMPQAARQALAIEPMTCASDAFNHPEWGLKRLEPGESFSGAYRIQSR